MVLSSRKMSGKVPLAPPFSSDGLSGQLLQRAARATAVQRRFVGLKLAERLLKLLQLALLVIFGWLVSEVGRVNRSAEHCALIWNYVVWFGCVTRVVHTAYFPRNNGLGSCSDFNLENKLFISKAYLV